MSQVDYFATSTTFRSFVALLLYLWMHHLIEVIQIALNSGTRDIYSLLTEAERSPNSLAYNLLQGIIEERITGDIEAQKILYGKQYSHKSSRAFEKLKERLFWKVVDSVFSLDTSKGGAKRTIARYQSNKYATAAKILSYRNASNAAVYVAKSLLPDAIQYQQCEAVVSLLHVLIANHIWKSEKKNKKVFQQYVQLHEFWSAASHAEQTIHREYNATLFDHNIFIQTHKLSDKKKMHQLIEQTRTLRDKTESYYSLYQTSTLWWLMHRIRMSLAVYENDHQQALSTLHSAQEYQSQHPEMVTSIQIGELSDHTCSMLLSHGMFTEAEHLAIQSQTIFPEGSYNWFRHCLQLVKILLINEKITEANEVYSRVKSHPRFYNLPEPLKNTHKLLQMYANLFSTENPTLTTERKKPLTLREFGKTLGLEQKVESENRIVILMMFTLTVLNEQTTEQLVITNESLQRMRRKLLDKESPRLSIFFKLIHTMIKCDFNKARTEEQTATLLSMLREHLDSEGIIYNEQHEIIPVEVLWKVIFQKYCS